VNSVAFSPGGEAIAIGSNSYGQNLRLARVADGSVLRVFEGDPSDFLGHVAFTPDGRYILSSSRGYPPRMWIWDAADGSLAEYYEQEVGWRYGPSLAVSPDGGMIGIGRVDATVEIATNPFGPLACYPDFDQNGVLDLFDFLAYVNSFNGEDDQADCTDDDTFDIFDFLCFVNEFNEGC
jgi:WD40 repeat protein